MTMTDLDRLIREHWATRNNVTAMARGLARGDPRLEKPTIEELAARDQMHAGVLDATERFAAWAGITPGERVLDLGSGLGGSARFLASRTGARVVALELVEELHRVAAELTRRCGLEGAVEHVRADGARAAVIDDGAFDVVWIQHVEMQVRDKAGLYATAARCLAPGGRVVWHDWLAGPGGPPHWPMFWSADGSISFHVPETDFREHLRRAGLGLVSFEPIAEQTVAWFGEARRSVFAALFALGAEDPPPLARMRKIELLALEMENAIRNIRERRLVPFFARAKQ